MLFLMNPTHLILERIICSVDDDVGELVETNAQEENASKPLELEVQARRIVRRCLNLP